MIELTWRDRVAVLTLDRPEKHNALTVELCHRIRGALDEAAEARVVVITGRGRSFCSGADLDEVYTADFRDALYAMLHAVTDLPKPVVAAVNGAAIGAGTQLAIAADFRVVAPPARFGVPTAKIGLAVDPWTIRRLALIAGNATARRLLLACDQVDADAAVACGLADRAGGTDEALAWAQGMTSLAPLTQSYSKRVLNAVFEPAFDGPLSADLEAAFEGCWTSEDFAEGRRSRAERRPPVFRGR
jgi:enoyl-CoA hydratase